MPSISRRSPPYRDIPSRRRRNWSKSKQQLSPDYRYQASAYDVLITGEHTVHRGDVGQRCTDNQGIVNIEFHRHSPDDFQVNGPNHTSAISLDHGENTLDCCSQASLMRQVLDLGQRNHRNDQDSIRVFENGCGLCTELAIISSGARSVHVCREHTFSRQVLRNPVPACLDLLRADVEIAPHAFQILQREGAVLRRSRLWRQKRHQDPGAILHRRFLQRPDLDHDAVLNARRNPRNSLRTVGARRKRQAQRAKPCGLANDPPRRMRRPGAVGSSRPSSKRYG